MLTLLIILLWTQQIEGIMNTKRITEQKGFVDIYIKSQEIVQETDVVLHIINLHDIETILDNMTENIKLMKIDNKEMLNLELSDAKNKLLTLLPKQSRQRRGLINGIGSIQKWLFGTMDDEDRQNIQKQLFNIDEIVNNNNQQIIINDYFNITINHLKMVITNDRQKIQEELNSINKFLKIENNKSRYLEQLSNIQLIKSRIEHLQDNVISAKYGLVHPSILTSNEIKKYNIDYNKLKYIQCGTTFVNGSYLVLGVKIPKKFIIVKLRIIVPLPNIHNNEIDAITEKSFEFENKTYRFEENKHLKDLKLSTHCTIKNNCQLVSNKDFEIIQLDIDTIIIKNAMNISVNETCNSEKVMLNGNYLINFSNCSIRIKDYYFSNTIENIKEKQIIENPNTTQNFTHKLSFQEIELQQKNNVKNIKTLNYHTKLTYGCNFFIIIVVLILIVLILTKHKQIKIKLNRRIQENSNLKGGEVTYIKNDPIDDFLANIQVTK